MPPPVVSIIVPVYNVERYISRSADSIFRQTLQDIEIIFVDDCSPDDSILIVERILDKYPQQRSKTKFIRKKGNEGLAAARLSGLQYATGEYVLQVDSDDYLALNAAELLWKEAQSINADIVICDYYNVYAERQVRRTFRPALTGLDCMAQVLRGEMPSFVWNKLIRRKLFVQNNVWPVPGLNMLEDRAVMYRLFYFAKRISYVPHALYYYVFNTSSITTKMSEDSVQNSYCITRYVDEFYKEHSILDPILLEAKHIHEIRIRANVALYGAQLYCRLYGSSFSCKDLREALVSVYLSKVEKIILILVTCRCFRLCRLIRLIQILYRRKMYS